MSPVVARKALLEWLDFVPASKIAAFGADMNIIDGVYGHQYIARVTVSKALADAVEEGITDVKGAKKIAKMLFYDNPVEFYRLKLK